MKITNIAFALGVAGASLLTAGNALADEGAMKDTAGPAALSAQTMSGSATVAKIDAKTRHLTLKLDDGSEATVRVPDAAKRFDEIKKGDHVNVDYYQSVAISLGKGEPATSQQSIVAKGAGKLPGGVVADQLTVSAEITKIDGDKVTLKRPDGTLDTVDVTDDSLKQDLAKLKVGDKIRATYTEAVAIKMSRDSAAK